MPTRISVPGLEPFEESRLIAETIADLHYIMGTIVENAGELVPGESVDELKSAWSTSEGLDENSAMRLLITNLTSPAGQPSISHEILRQHQLTGEVGKLKRSLLGRLKDRFFMFWNSEPRNDEKRIKSAEAASDYLDLGATFVSSIPGYEKVVELVSLVSQLLSFRIKRDF